MPHSIAKCSVYFMYNYHIWKGKTFLLTNQAINKINISQMNHHCKCKFAIHHKILIYFGCYWIGLFKIFTDFCQKRNSYYSSKQKKEIPEVWYQAILLPKPVLHSQAIEKLWHMSNVQMYHPVERWLFAKF